MIIPLLHTLMYVLTKVSQGLGDAHVVVMASMELDWALASPFIVHPPSCAPESVWENLCIACS